MSYSGRIKEELAREIPKSRHCCIAELAAVISLCGNVHFDEYDRVRIEIHTENAAAARKYFTLLKKTFNISSDLSFRQGFGSRKTAMCILTVDDDDAAARDVLKACRLIRDFNEIGEDMALTDKLLLKRDCCRRAFIRGAFLASGSINDPQGKYHFEIVCHTPEKAEQISGLMRSFDISARVTKRRNSYIVYVKDGSSVADLLRCMGAYTALMDMENIRIMKDMRNQVNRQVNCETANINKTVAAAMRQIDDINYLKESHIFDELPDHLKEAAQLRVRFPEASLAELGSMLKDPVGRSGVNHRLKKISALADEHRVKYFQ